MSDDSYFESRWPDFVPLTVDQLREQIALPVVAYPDDNGSEEVNKTVHRIRKEADDEVRLAKLRVLFDGSTGSGWGPGVSSSGSDAMPMVGHRIKPPICRFDWVGNRGQAAANMRFIVGAHENFDWLLELAAEGLAARQAKVS